MRDLPISFISEQTENAPAPAAKPRLSSPAPFLKHRLWKIQSAPG